MVVASAVAGGWTHHPAETGVFCDFDGTLSPIVADPARARPLPGAVEVLARLASGYRRVAVISGRPVAYLDQHLGHAGGVVLAGLYGMERSIGGRVVVDAEAASWREVVEAVVDDARSAAPPGVGVESKGLSVTLHARGAPGQLGWIEAWAGEKAAATGLAAHAGRLSVELRPPVGGDKGSVVTELGAGLRAACFFGDDRGDLPAFAALRRLAAGGMATLAVAVRSDESPPELLEQADAVVDGPEGALEVLQALAAGLG